MKTKIHTLILMAFFAAAMMSCNPIEPYTPTTQTEPVKPVDPRTQPPVPVAGCVVFAEWPMKDACVAVADRNGDKEVQFDEAEAVIELIISGKGITDPKGLECFKNVKKLDISRNSLTDISIVENIIGIEWLDFSNNNISKEFHFNAYGVFYNLKYLDGRGNPNMPSFQAYGCYEGPSFMIGRPEDSKMHHTTFGHGAGNPDRLSDNYKSTDFTHHYERHILQEPTDRKGMVTFSFGISLQDKSFANGAAEEIAGAIVDTLFSYEPFKHFKDRCFIWYSTHVIDAPQEEESIAIARHPGMWDEERFIPYYDTPRFGFGFQTDGKVSMVSSLKGNHVSSLSVSIPHEMAHDFAVISDEYTINILESQNQINNSRVADPNDPMFPIGWARLLKEEKYQKRIGIYQFMDSSWYLPVKEKGIMGPANDTGPYFNAVCRFGIFAAFKFAEICPVLKYNFREIGQDSSTVPGGGNSFQVKYNAFMSPSGIDSGKRFGDVSTDPKSPYKVWNDWRDSIFEEWFENTFQEFLAYDVVNDYIGY